MKKFDAVVVGAGAVGCVAARELARWGLETIVFEEHSGPGKYGKCTGLVSARGLELVGADYKKAVVSRISGAVIHSPHYSFEARRKNVAVVLDRQAFDEECAAEAAGAGAELKVNSRVTGVNEKGVVVGKKFFSSSFIVGADGAQSLTAKALGFPPIRDFVLCCEKEFPRARLGDEEAVEVFLDNELFPGFFAWIVPAGGGARIGFGTKEFDSAKSTEKRFFEKKKVKEVVGGRRPSRSYWAVIPLAPRERTQEKNVLLVGDAAGQVKATTGGGIVFGGLCAKTAAECVAEAVVNKEPPDCERRWRKRFGGVLAAHSVARKFLDALPNAALDLLVASANYGPKQFLEWFGDMDFILR